VILVDTSVWIDHLRAGDRALVRLLEDRSVFGHPFVLGELSLGNMRQRAVALRALAQLPQIEAATDPEVVQFIENEKLQGRGIGYIDAHLLASLRLSPGSLLWTRDARLHTVASELKLAAPKLK
jgi:predicted nucleic acid-binding protein